MIVHIVHLYNFCIVSFDVIRPLPGLCDKQGFTKFLIILPKGTVKNVCNTDICRSFYFIKC